MRTNKGLNISNYPCLHPSSYYDDKYYFITKNTNQLNHSSVFNARKGEMIDLTFTKFHGHSDLLYFYIRLQRFAFIDFKLKKLPKVIG